MRAGSRSPTSSSVGCSRRLASSASAVLARHRGGVWSPLLVAIYGLGLVIAGAWHPDPGAGFPPGTPLHLTTPMSGHYIVHWIGFILVNTVGLEYSVICV